MQSRVTNRKVIDIVKELESNGYSEIEAIKYVHETYNVNTPMDSISFITHLSSIVLLLSLFVSSPFLLAFRIPLGILYTIFLSGYITIRTFYRKGYNELSGLTLIGLSLGVGFAVITLFGFLLNFTLGITEFTSIIAIVSFTEALNIIDNILRWKK